MPRKDYRDVQPQVYGWVDQAPGARRQPASTVHSAGRAVRHRTVCRDDSPGADVWPADAARRIAAGRSVVLSKA